MKKFVNGMGLFVFLSVAASFYIMIGGELTYYNKLSTEPYFHNHTQKNVDDWDDDDDWEEAYGDIRRHKKVRLAKTQEASLAKHKKVSRANGGVRSEALTKFAGCLNSVENLSSHFIALKCYVRSKYGTKLEPSKPTN